MIENHDWLSSLQARYGRRTLIALALIAVLGFSLRAVTVVSPAETPGDDSRAYYALSKSIYEEGSFGGPGFTDSSDWSPGAPWLYATAYAVTGGPREGTARIVEAILGVATIFVVFMLGWRIGGRGPALVAAMGVAVYPPFVHTVGELMSEPPAMLTLPAAVLSFLWAWEKQKAWAWIVPGLLFGLTAMFRPEYLLVAGAFVVVTAGRMAWERRWRLGASTVAVMTVALLLPIVPWTIRNFVVLDRLVPISTGGGKALFVGSFYPADGEYQRVKAILYARATGHRLPPHSEELESVDPTPLFGRVARRYHDLPRDSALGKVGKENLSHWFREDPVGYLGMTVRKVGRMWSSGVGEAMSSTLGRAVQLLLVGLAIAGSFLLAIRRRWWELTSLATPVVIVTAVGAISLAAPRRNEVLMTLVFPLVGLALSAAGSFLRRKLMAAPREQGRHEVDAGVGSTT